MSPCRKKLLMSNFLQSQIIHINNFNYFIINKLGCFKNSRIIQALQANTKLKTIFL